MVVYRPNTITLDSSYTRVTTIATRWGEWMEWRPPPGLMCGSYSTFTTTFTQDHRLNYRNIAVLARNTTGKLLQIQVFTNPRTLDSCPRACLGKCGKSSINRCFLAPRESHLAYSSPQILGFKVIRIFLNFECEKEKTVCSKLFLNFVYINRVLSSDGKCGCKKTSKTLELNFRSLSSS